MPNTDNDRFVKLLKIETAEVRFGFARARAFVGEDFLNGLDIANGGFLYTLADFACALATNADGHTAVSSNAGMEYLSPCPLNTTVEAAASFLFSNKKTALCTVKIYDADNTENLYATFQSRLIFKNSK